MNIANLDRLIAALEAASPEMFDMSNYWDTTNSMNNTEILMYVKSLSAPPCGTAACFAGWCTFLASTQDLRFNRNGGISFMQTGCNFLGLDFPTATDLFHPQHRDDWNISRDDALKLLRHLRATGEVRWPGVTKADKLPSAMVRYERGSLSQEFVMLDG